MQPYRALAPGRRLHALRRLDTLGAFTAGCCILFAYLLHTTPKGGVQGTPFQARNGLSDFPSPVSNTTAQIAM